MPVFPSPGGQRAVEFFQAVEKAGGGCHPDIRERFPLTSRCRSVNRKRVPILPAQMARQSRQHLLQTLLQSLKRGRSLFECRVQTTVMPARAALIAS